MTQLDAIINYVFASIAIAILVGIEVDTRIFTKLVRWISPLYLYPAKKIAKYSKQSFRLLFILIPISIVAPIIDGWKSELKKRQKRR